jgi:Zn-dependent protease with chaperone function
VTNVDSIESIAVPDYRIQAIIKRFGFIYVKGKRFRNPNIPCAFAVGNRLWGSPVGTIYVSELAFRLFTPEELEWIVLHELAHIVNDHIPAKCLWEIISVGGAAFLASYLEISFPLAKLFVTFLRTFSTIRTGGITATQELLADQLATATQGVRDHGLSALRKLSGNDIDRVSHYATGLVFKVPALTIRDRIDAILRDPTHAART